MPQTLSNGPATGACAEQNTGDTAWLSAADGAVEDGTPATCDIPYLGPSARSNALVYSGFSFPLAFPDSTNVVGLKITPVRWCTANNGAAAITDNQVFLRKAGVNVGPNLAAYLWSTTPGDSSQTYLNGNGDTDGVSVELGDVLDAGFGVWLQCKNIFWDSGVFTETASVDECYLTVFHQTPSEKLLLMGLGAAIAALGIRLWLPALGPAAAFIAAAMLGVGVWRGRVRSTTGRAQRRRMVPCPR